VPRKVIVDAGPLIALFDKDDAYHQQALTFLEGFQGTLLSNHAVTTEVTHLLDFSVRVQIDFLRWIAAGGISLQDISNEDVFRIVELVEKYAGLPMDYADASLVALGERLSLYYIASVDKDFSIYRAAGKKTFRNVFF